MTIVEIFEENVEIEFGVNFRNVNVEFASETFGETQVVFLQDLSKKIIYYFTNKMCSRLKFVF
jgi:hypothetical protein